MSARSILSILCTQDGMTYDDLRRICSEDVEIVVGTEVQAFNNGHEKLNGIISNIFDDTYEIKHTDETLTIIEKERVHAKDSIQCSSHQIFEAKKLALRKFPGARQLPIIKKPQRMSKERVAFVAAFLRSPDNVDPVEASLRNSSKGVKYRLKANRSTLWEKLSLEMSDANLKPVSWGYFHKLTTSDGSYEMMTADNCCCGTCRDLGLYNFKELENVIKQLVQDLISLAPSPSKWKEIYDKTGKDLIARTKKQTEFLLGSYYSHLKSSDGCGSHCLTHLLSTYNNENFRKDCEHGRDDDVVNEHPITWTQRVWNEEQREAEETDWDGVCCICGEGGRKERWLCKYCNETCHKECIEFNCKDMPDKDPSGDGEKWTCPNCVIEIDDVHHSSSCELCNEFGYIIDDVMRLINVLEHLEEESKDHKMSEMLHARLQQVIINQKLFRAHKTRHRNQDFFRDTCLRKLSLYAFYVLVDYWSKLKVLKSHTANCEGEEIG